MLRLMAPKNLAPLRENMFNFREGTSSAEVEAYIIPALKVVCKHTVSQQKEDSISMQKQQ